MWDLRGPIMRLLEDIPFVGYVVAGIDALDGDTVSGEHNTSYCHLIDQIV